MNLNILEIDTPEGGQNKVGVIMMKTFNDILQQQYQEAIVSYSKYEELL